MRLVLRMLLVGVVCGLGVGATPASAASPYAKLRLLTEGARSFGSDGVRYVVYVHESPGKQGASPLVIVDTAKGMSRRSVTLPPDCILGAGPVAMTPGFLLACSRRSGETVLVDLAHGSLLRVPSWFDVGGVPHSAEFTVVGREWLQGYVTCPDGRYQCVAYENWHTGEQRREDAVGAVRRDLDDPALPAEHLCAPFKGAHFYEMYGRYVLLNLHGDDMVLGRCGHEGFHRFGAWAFGGLHTLASEFVSWTGGTCVHTVRGYDINRRRASRWAVPRIRRRPSCGIVMHTANAVIIGSSLNATKAGFDTYRFYVTRRP
jgi:hypothetical protein